MHLTWAGLYDVKKHINMKPARPAKDNRLSGLSKATSQIIKVTVAMVLSTYRSLKK